jgi:alanine dehydrogenase
MILVIVISVFRWPDWLLLPFTLALAGEGLERALTSHPALRHGVATHQGRVVNSKLAFHLGVPEVTL